MFSKILRFYAISDDQVFVLSVDSAANISKAIKDLIDQINTDARVALGEVITEEEAGSGDLDSVNELILNGAQPEGIDIIPEGLKFAFLVNCVAHILQLAINKFMWKNATVKSILDKAIHLTTKLRTPIVKLKLDSEDKMQAKAHQLTRWNSVFLMLKRLLDLEEFCISHQDEESFYCLMLSEDTWKQFEEVFEVLGLAATLTKKLQAENLLVPDFLYD